MELERRAWTYENEVIVSYPAIALPIIDLLNAYHVFVIICQKLVSNLWTKKLDPSFFVQKMGSSG